MNQKTEGGNIQSEVNPFNGYALADYSDAIAAGKPSIQFDGQQSQRHPKTTLEMTDQSPQELIDMGAVENVLSEPRYSKYTVSKDGSGDTAIQMLLIMLFPRTLL